MIGAWERALSCQGSIFRLAERFVSWREELKTPGIQTRQPKPSAAPASLWTKCLDCGAILYRVEIERNHHVCLKCGFHFIMPARDRIKMLCDAGSFQEFDAELVSSDPLQFVDQKPYRKRIQQSEEKSGERESAIWGKAKIEEMDLAVCVFVFEFMAGSMGSVAGEKVTKTFEYALEKKIPALVVSSSGGARMQEGLFSLLQMAKTCAALQRLKRAGLPYISLLAHPTTGGVAASFAILGDINLAEPEALIGFAGPRVIEQTIRQKLPEGFQKAGFLLEHGMVDQVLERKKQRATIARIMRLLRHRSSQTES